jgi:hypothetical protein
MILKGGLMNALVVALTMTAGLLLGMFSFAQEQRRYPVDPRVALLHLSYRWFEGLSLEKKVSPITPPFPGIIMVF